MKRLLMAVGLLAVLMMSLDISRSGGGERDKGWVQLFNGKDLAGWIEIGKEKWTVEDNGIRGQAASKQYGYLRTEKNYKDFEMWVDWKITKGGDSGVYLRGRPQVQIWDNPEGSGGLWNNPKDSPGKVPLVVADKKPGMWNTFYIKMVGTKVTVKLNGKLVVDNAVMLDGKVPATGPIELQVHGTPLWFKNVFVKELD